MFAINPPTNLSKRIFLLMSEYARLLEHYRQTPDATMRRLGRDALIRFWQAQSNNEVETQEEVDQQTKAFYSSNELLYATANQTTGDTPKQLGDFAEFAGRFYPGLRGATIADIGCGDGARITAPMARMLSESCIIGIDHAIPELKDKPDNLSFKLGRFNDLPFKDSELALATAHWSVANDLLLRSTQLEAFAELRRVLADGGFFYTDVPTIEGEFGYLDAAKEYHAKNPDAPFGMIEREFPGDRSKRFYIYPLAELSAMLESFDFEIIDIQQWTTQGKQSRATLSARLNKAS